MTILTILLSVFAALATSYLAYHHQTPLFLFTAFCAVMVALILLLGRSGVALEP